LLTVLAWVHLRWNDWRLAWDPKKFAGINKLNIPVGVIKRLINLFLNFNF